MARRRLLESDPDYALAVSQGRDPNPPDSQGRVEYLSIEEEVSERKKEADEAIARRQQTILDADARHDTKLAAVKDLADDELENRRVTLMAQHDQLDKDRIAVRDKMIDASAELAAIEAVQYDRRKAGWLTASIGGPPDPRGNGRS